jgi:hypothetical protein
MEPFLGFAKKLASGQRLKLGVSDYARTNVGQASEEAQGLAMFREMGLDIVPDDPVTMAKGEAELKKLIDEKVRSALAEAMTSVEQRFESFPQSLVGSLQTKLPNDPENLETRTFFDAIDAYRKHLLKTGKRQENGNPSPSVQNYVDTARRFKKTMDDLPVWEIDRTKLDEMFGHWRNRPVSSKTGKRIASDTAKHLMDTLWSVLTWIDEADNWKWSLPNGAKRIRRTPEQIDSDRKKLRTRRISASTYTPEQLAVIASKLDRFGKMILGIAVNCAMQPAEVGRLEIDAGTWDTAQDQEDQRDTPSRGRSAGHTKSNKRADFHATYSALPGPVFRAIAPAADGMRRLRCDSWRLAMAGESKIGGTRSAGHTSRVVE